MPPGWSMTELPTVSAAGAVTRHVPDRPTQHRPVARGVSGQ